MISSLHPSAFRGLSLPLRPGIGLRRTVSAPEEVGRRGHRLFLSEFLKLSAWTYGAFHRLKVKVDRDGVQAQARHGYFMPKPEKAKTSGSASPIQFVK
jgi:hypothetical protein